MKHLHAFVLVLCCLVAVAGCSQATPIAQDLVTIRADWNDNAVDHRDQTGVRFVYACPPNPTKAGVGTAWGTDTYSDDSSVCTAGVHAGAITFAGGSVTVEIRGGLDSYAGSTRNGVTTQDWGAWSGSFVVL